jgi:hypothetical protein
MSDDTQTIQAGSATDGGSVTSHASGGEAPSLQSEVAGWGRVARQSYRECRRAADATTELNRRQNASGQ